ncbi:YIP1 family protein [Candidatus Aminicenantes bacterium AH-873-B07]|jgi:hypothetical protein|nr:YIP1 family protein [Candidatus Aminicenantes bacterium AH-873-B07]
MTLFWSYFGGVVIKPRSTFNRLLKDPQHLIYGVKAFFLIGVLYTLTVIGLAIVRAEIVFPAWIAIPAEDYYFWEIFFTLPVFLLGWILAAGLVQLLSKIFKGNGTFEGSLAVLGFAMAIPAFVMWIPETIATILFLLGVMTQKEWIEISARPGFWHFFAASYQFIALAWHIVLFSIAISVTQKLRWRQAIIIGTLVVAIISFMMMIFIR